MKRLNLGAFSISLAVNDLEKSRIFYEDLGFMATGGGEGYVILRQGTSLIGLFQGMFKGNILTFNPGVQANRADTDNPLVDWRVEDFDDVREIQNRLREKEISLIQSVNEDENPDGPGSVTLQDPDGNMILIDQFFPRPERSDRETTITKLDQG